MDNIAIWCQVKLFSERQLDLGRPVLTKFLSKSAVFYRRCHKNILAWFSFRRAQDNYVTCSWRSTADIRKSTNLRYCIVCQSVGMKENPRLVGRQCLHPWHTGRQCRAV